MASGSRVAAVTQATLILFTLGMVVACDGVIHDPPEYDSIDSDTPPPIERPPDEELIALEFDPSAENLINPERGFYRGVDLFDFSDAQNVRDAGRTLALAIVELDPSGPIDAAFLAGLDDGFERVRDAGIKIVLRFRYSTDYDAPKSVILGQLEQLAPILRGNADVIAFMQAGFIGRWGEWHGSTNGLDNPEDRSDILHGILDALPTERMVQVRTPMFKADAFPDGPTLAAMAFSGEDEARVGHHNDCFLASESDYGTYASPVDEWIDYVAEDSVYTPVGGETCIVNAPRSDCGEAMAEMQATHWSYLNWEYQREVLDRWADQGCMAQVERELGYRFRLTDGYHTKSVAPGGSLYVEFSVANDGFAGLFNERPVMVTLDDGTTRLSAELTTVDPRAWRTAESKVAARLQVPADLAPGTYSISIELPDRAETLASDPRYAVAFANDGVWRPGYGDNVLSTQLEVSVDAPGLVDGTATEFLPL